MNKEEEIEDSLRFCKEMQLYYKSGLFENPRNVFEWEKYIPLAREEVQKKYQEEIVYHNKKLEEAVQYSIRLMEEKQEEDSFAVRVSGGGTAILEPPGQIDLPERKKKEEIEDIESEEEEEEKEVGFLKIVAYRFVEAVICIVLAFAISAGFNKYIGTHTIVEGSSMESTLHDGDYLLVDKLSYRFGNPQRFDIIVFSYSEDTYYIKRIIGLPGEKIRITEGKIYINGQELQETYGLETMLDGGLAVEETTIGEGEYFVLGDNRNHSTDSRSESVGTIKTEDIVGKAFFRFYPINDIGSVK